jgi:hypothetical protein
MSQKGKLFHSKYISILIIVQIWSGVLVGQRTFTKADVREMFPANTKNLWINYLSGSIDNKHTADMIIGTDGHTCKGLYTMRSSKTTFFFEGEEREKQLHLAEMNGDARFTGFLNGQYDGASFVGQWMNKDQNIVLPVKLDLVNAFENFTPNKKLLHQWNRIFVGAVAGKSLKLQIAKNENSYQGILSDGENERKRETTAGTGSRVEMLRFDFNNSVFSDKWIMLDTSNLEKVDVIYPDQDGYEMVTTLRTENLIEYDLYEYADYNSRLECIRPVTGSKRFDSWMNSVFKKWLDHNLKSLKNIEKDDVGTNERWVQCAHGWVEVTYFDGMLISGTVYMQTSWDQETAKIPFIYDLRYGRALNLQDIFDNKFDSKEYFRILVPDLVKSTSWGAGIKSWVVNQNFDHVCLKDEGIGFSTPYSTIYGEREIVVPYTSIQQNLRARYVLK